MAGSGKKWFVGCGIGCGLLIVILVGMGSCTYFGVKRIGNRVDKLEAAAEALSERYGDAEDYTPPVDGVIADDRMEAFLQVRRATLDGENGLAGYLAVLDDRPDEQGREPGKLAKIKAGLKLLPAIFDFAEERNRALIEAEMGIGEYAYIYALSYFVFLDKDLRDGPSFSVMDEDDQEEGNVHWSFGSGAHDEEAIREKRERELRDYLNDLGRTLLGNQLAALDEANWSTGELTAEAWRRQLAGELDLLRKEPLRLPWEEGLPERIGAALEIYRGDLQESYDDLLSPLDIGLTQKD